MGTVGGVEVVIRSGTWVRLKAIPPDVAALDERTRAIFDYCLGQLYPVEEMVHARGSDIVLRVLDISGDIDHRFGGFMNDIRVEDAYLEVVPGPELGYRHSG